MLEVVPLGQKIFMLWHFETFTWGVCYAHFSYSVFKNVYKIAFLNLRSYSKFATLRWNLE